jgi:DNA-directed RNA polymerase subunit RPC12/RpoP
MNVKKIVLVLIAVLALGQAAYLTWSYMQEEQSSDENASADYLCLTPECRAEFTVTRDEILRLTRVDEGVPCPKCRKYAVQPAAKCPTCKSMVKLVGHGSFPDKCTKCGSPFSMTPSGLDANLLCGGSSPEDEAPVEVAKTTAP